MSVSDGSKNVQARALLEILRNFMLPIIQTALGKTIKLENIHFGIEGEEFVNALEKFISGVVSRSQPRNQELIIKARLGKGSFYNSEENQAAMSGRSNDTRNPENLRTNCAIPLSMSLSGQEKDLAKKLQLLRKHVTQKMPIRLLRFEPNNSKLKISLLEREDIYNYLALKFRADFNKELILVDLWISDYAGYAILSHTWSQTPGELTYSDWQKGSLDPTEPKCRKLVNFCKAAYENHRLTLGWIDTICINKDSSAELDESIRSMYAWYREAQVCITYLAESKAITEMRNDPWFTRGWTLQELVAPQYIKFYNKDWNQLSKDRDDKNNPSIRAEITLATTITPHELQQIWTTSISRRMQLAATRQVTREEDIAYCLMGIFDVSISTAYGEGADRAFFRLVEEIFRSAKDVSHIFNWAGNRKHHSRQYISSLFPSRPSDFLNRSEQFPRWRPIEPLTLTHLGLRTPVLLMPAVPILESVGPVTPIGDYHADVSVAPYTSRSRYQSLPKNYRLLDKRASGPEVVYEAERIETFAATQAVNVTLTFGTLNVEEQGANIRIPKNCLAVLLKWEVKASSPRYEKIYTKKPIVFDLKKIENHIHVNGEKHYYELERSELVNHGMQLVTLYL